MRKYRYKVYRLKLNDIWEETEFISPKKITVDNLATSILDYMSDVIVDEDLICSILFVEKISKALKPLAICYLLLEDTGAIIEPIKATTKSFRKVTSEVLFKILAIEMSSQCELSREGLNLNYFLPSVENS